MTAQAAPFWQSIRNVFSGQALIHDDSPRRIRVTEDEARALPDGVRQIRVFSGGAWVSSFGENVLLHEGQSLLLGDKQGSVAVTAIGRKPVVLELID